MPEYFFRLHGLCDEHSSLVNLLGQSRGCICPCLSVPLSDSVCMWHRTSHTDRPNEELRAGEATMEGSEA